MVRLVPRHLPAVGAGALVGALAGALACSRLRASSPPDPLPWVDPSRCLAPCAGPPPSALVGVDARGHAAEPGLFRLHRDAQPALEALLSEAASRHLSLTINGAHRAHEQQAHLFASASDIGRFARPGHSEHELGLAVDLDYDGDEALAFLQARGPAFGFVTSYPAGQERTTGFRAEPWHQRYVGAALAAELTARHLTLQAYLEANPSRGRWGDCADCADPLSRARCDADLPPRCDGSVLRWCMHGSPAAVDCATTGASCDPVTLRCVGP